MRVPPEGNASIDELRNRYGRDHGRDTPLRGLTGRHARLAVNSGTANCRFLFDTLAGPAAVADPVLDPGYVSAAVRNGVVAQGPVPRRHRRPEWTAWETKLLGDVSQVTAGVAAAGPARPP